MHFEIANKKSPADRPGIFLREHSARFTARPGNSGRTVLLGEAQHAAPRIGIAHVRNIVRAHREPEVAGGASRREADLPDGHPPRAVPTLHGRLLSALKIG